jgi:hypothetical protein
MRRIGVMVTLWNFAAEDAKFLDPRRISKPAPAGFGPSRMCRSRTVSDMGGFAR